jgi:O-antigen/teichoic acid export membrane protein
MTSPRPGSFFRNFLSSAGGSIVLLVSHLLITVVLARVWAEGEFGRFTLASTLIFCLELIADFGLRMWAIQHLAISSNTRQSFRNIRAARLLLSILTVGISLVAPLNALSLRELLLCGLVAVTQPTVDPALWLLRAKEKLYVESVVVAVWRVISFAVFALIAFLGWRLEALLVAWLVANGLRGVVALCLPAFHEIAGALTPGPGVTLRESWAVIRGAFPFGICILLVNVSHRIPLFLVEQVGTASDLALFGLTTRLLYAFSFVASSITMATFPSLMKSVHEREKETADRLFERGLRYISWIMFAIGVAGIPASRFLIAPVFGQNYQPTGRMVGLMLPIAMTMSLNYYLGYLLTNLQSRVLEIATSLAGMIILISVVLTTTQLRLELRVALGWMLAESVKLAFRSWVIARMTGFGGYWPLKLAGLVVLLAACSAASYRI